MNATAVTSPLRAVLFDMDGTLVDTESLWWQTVDEQAAGLGLAVDDADLPEILGRPVEHTAAHLAARAAARAGGRGPAGAVLAAGLAADLERRFTELIADRAATRNLPTMPGALELLDALSAAGIATALVSASPRPVVDLVLGLLGRERFATSRAAGETAQTKPHPAPYLAAAHALGVATGACVAVEDTATGVASAEAAGCAVLAVPSLAPIEAGPGRSVAASLLDVDVERLERLVTRGSAVLRG